jgi:hypothetical protein
MNYISDNEQDTEITTYFDDSFRDIFFNTNGGDSIELLNMEELLNRIIFYEEQTGTKLYITKSAQSNGYRQYKFRCHFNCNFRATFGRRQGTNAIVLKRCFLYHTVTRI